MNSMHGSDDQKLDALFRAYRRCLSGTRTPSANFMPNLWARIESRQRFTFSFRRMANAFDDGGGSSVPRPGTFTCRSRGPIRVDYNQTYVEALAEANAPDSTDLVNPVTLDFVPSAQPVRGDHAQIQTVRVAFLLLVFLSGAVLGALSYRLYSISTVQSGTDTGGPPRNPSRRNSARSTWPTCPTP